MPLQRGEVQGYNFNRMAVEFTMVNQGKVIPCSISTAAKDDLEGRRDEKSDQRVDQFMRLREIIEERASRKFSKSRLKPTGPWYCDPTISHHDGFIVLAPVERTPMSALGQSRHCGLSKRCPLYPVAHKCQQRASGHLRNGSVKKKKNRVAAVSCHF